MSEEIRTLRRSMGRTDLRKICASKHGSASTRPEPVPGNLAGLYIYDDSICENRWEFIHTVRFWIDDVTERALRSAGKKRGGFTNSIQYNHDSAGCKIQILTQGSEICADDERVDGR